MIDSCGTVHHPWVSKDDPLCYVPTADPINLIKPDQAIGSWSGSVGMSDREGLPWSASLGLSTRIFLTCRKNPTSDRVAKRSRNNRVFIGLVEVLSFQAQLFYLLLTYFYNLHPCSSSIYFPFMVNCVCMYN